MQTLPCGPLGGRSVFLTGSLSESQVSMRIGAQHFRFGRSVRRLRCSPEAGAAGPCRLVRVECGRKRKLKSERLKNLHVEQKYFCYEIQLA
ncbi:hypothetical protein AOLI_G00103100 [Acnodon oligacanthus]